MKKQSRGLIRILTKKKCFFRFQNVLQTIQGNINERFGRNLRRTSGAETENKAKLCSKFERNFTA